MLETLESRRMLSSSVSASQSGSTVNVTGGSDGSVINVVETNGNVLVENVATGQAATFTGITKININAQAKNDTVFYTGNTVGAKISTGGGNDLISIDDRGTGSSYATGDGGDDVLDVLLGNHTTVVGGGGNDQIRLNTSL